MHCCALSQALLTVCINKQPLRTAPRQSPAICGEGLNKPLLKIQVHRKIYHPLFRKFSVVKVESLGCAKNCQFLAFFVVIVWLAACRHNRIMIMAPVTALHYLQDNEERNNHFFADIPIMAGCLVISLFRSHLLSSDNGRAQSNQNIAIASHSLSHCLHFIWPASGGQPSIFYIVTKYVK